MVRKTWIVDHVAKGFETNFPLANVGMAVHAGAEGGFGIVQMKSNDLFEADERFDLSNGFVPAFWRADVIAGSIKVGGIKAKAQPLWFSDLIENCGQVFDFVSKAGPLAGGVFQSNTDRRLFGRRKYFVQAGDNLFEGSRFAGAEVRAGMHDQEGEAEIGREADLLDEGLDGPVAIVAGLRAEIDEVARMTEDAGKSSGSQFAGVEGKLLRHSPPAEPLHVIFDENLDAVTMDAAGALQGAPGAASGGHVRAELHFGKQCRGWKGHCRGGTATERAERGL